MTLTPDDVHNATFRRPRRGKPGYDEHAVDIFLDRVEAALRGRNDLTAEDVVAVSLPLQQRRRRAYEKEAVDAFLDQVALTLMRRSARAQKSARRRTRPAVAEPMPPVAEPMPPAAEPMPPQAVAEQPTAPTMPRPEVVSDQPAYDRYEVDAFIDRVYATLRGEDTVTAQEVLAARFRPAPPGVPGYHEAGVAAFLVLVASSLRQLTPRRPGRPAQHSTAPQTHPLAESPRLTSDEIRYLALNAPPPGEPGYDQDEVDAFLDRVEDTLRGYDTLSAQDVHDVQFTLASPDQAGYDENEVEALLDLVEERLRLDAERPLQTIRVG